jgi:tetratricopeptide (TPR) repeat protein
MIVERLVQGRVTHTHAVGALLLCGLWLVATRSLAEELPAREHFERGVQASRDGDLVLALEHFEKAQALQPHPTVLYNLAQTYSTLGRPVDALSALERYLEIDPDAGEPALRRQAEELVRRNQARVGTLAVELTPVGARLEIDGAEAPVTGTGQRRVSIGQHLLTATHPGYRPFLTHVEVQASASTRLVIKLEPIGGQPDSFIEPKCAVPDVKVFLDGTPVGRTPEIALVPVASGTHTVRFERAGFAAWESSVVTSSKSVTRATCSLTPDPAGANAGVRVLTSEPKATVRVNGTPFRSGKLPLGRHVVEVTAPSFEPYRRVITVRAGTSNDVWAPLEPTPERRRTDREHTKRIVAYATGGVGLALGVASGILFVTSHDRYENWRKDHQQLANELVNGQAGPEQQALARDLQARAASIQRSDDIALAAGVLSGVCLAVSIGFLLSGDDPPLARSNRASNPLRFEF